jgi:glycogen operon protein
MATKPTTSAGVSRPLGATAGAHGVNFAIWSPHATRLWLALYRSATERTPFLEVELDPNVNRTFVYWHVLVPSARAGMYYTWRADGPREPGLAFDPAQELLDPWARAVSDALWSRHDARDGRPSAIRARIEPPDDYDWQGDEPLARELCDTIIYEMHVRGFTQHPSSRVAQPGTFRGIIDKIPHLVALGVTDVELLPVMAFDRQDVPRVGTAFGLTNFWGYAPYAFFAPHPHYAAGDDARSEFRDMVKALHAAGIGVILDVVLNHTAEGRADGPTIGFRGLANEVFYLRDPEDEGAYLDVTGCGNTLNANHPLVAQFMLDCLVFWAREMHVDGFRVDLASALARGEDGEPLDKPPLLWSIELAEPLAATRLIAEAWDATGFYQVGSFPGYRWAEWNGRYRDAVRRFLRGDAGLIGELATRIAGSSDLYQAAGKAPTSSINFVTCHDGFTLLDLVSYKKKHNEANAENNRDGRDDNFSWNCGIEGPTDDPVIQRLREQHARNFIAVLMLSQGVPMLLAGDEVLRTQRGNNNAYCQDNDLSWMDWSFAPAARAMLRFTREMIALRKRHASLRRTRFFEPPAGEDDERAEIRWYGENLEPPAWNDKEARVLCFTIAGRAKDEPALHVCINMTEVPKSLRLPHVAPRSWRRVADTTLTAPDDVTPAGVPQIGALYRLAARGIAIFEAL